jgi:curli production assembly/transport component CsgG
VNGNEVLSSYHDVQQSTRTRSGSVFSFVAVGEILEIDAGYSINELSSVAVRWRNRARVFNNMRRTRRHGAFQNPYQVLLLG